jgi:hypothetical protein
MFVQHKIGPRRILAVSLRNGERLAVHVFSMTNAKNAFLECIDENASIVLDEVMEKLKQIFTE